MNAPKQDAQPSELLFELDQTPPLGKSVTAAFAHLLAIVGGIVTAPLIIARGLGLDIPLTTYLVASALVISGIATFIQVKRIGALGSGLLSIQGTSFAFVGVFIYAGLNLKESGHSDAEILGTLLGTASVGGLLTMILSLSLKRLASIITINVAGIVVFLLGLSLVWVAIGNLRFAVSQAEQMAISAAWIYLQAATVIAIIIGLSLQKNAWLKLSSIMLGIICGTAIAWATNSLTEATVSDVAFYFLPSVLPFGWSFDLGIFLLIAPIFLVTVTESIGDLTATALLSKQPVEGDGYWQRLRGGVMADGFNTSLAALFGTFPNTTFSQNNGVIRITGVASRHIGLILAGMLILLGSVPIISALFQMLPGGVLHGATGLMFGMIMLTGWRMLSAQPNPRYVLTMAISCTLIALGLTQIDSLFAWLGWSLPTYVAMMTNFPVASGAVAAMIWEAVARPASATESTP